MFKDFGGHHDNWMPESRKKSLVFLGDVVGRVVLLEFPVLFAEPREGARQVVVVHEREVVLCVNLYVLCNEVEHHNSPFVESATLLDALIACYSGDAKCAKTNPLHIFVSLFEGYGFCVRSQKSEVKQNQKIEKTTTDMLSETPYPRASGRHSETFSPDTATSSSLTTKFAREPSDSQAAVNTSAQVVPLHEMRW